MASRKLRPAPKKSRRKPKLDPREKALVEWYFRKGPGRSADSGSEVKGEG